MSEADRQKWDARYANAERAGAPPSWLHAHDESLPRAGRALDVASGTGRLALWARARGLDVTAVDISSVGLEKLRVRAPDVEVIAHDLEADPRVPDGPFALVTCVRYWQPSLWPALRAALAPGGVIVAEALGLANLERHAHPSRRFLAAPGALRDAAAPLLVEHYAEGWLDGQYSARLIARKRSP